MFFYILDWVCKISMKVRFIREVHNKIHIDKRK